MVEEIFLQKAIAKAWESQTFALPNPSVGALILSNDFKVLALESHTCFGSSHAELLAIREAFIALHSSQADFASHLRSFPPKELWGFLAENHNGAFRECTLFVTLEPCLHEGKTPPCAKLIAQLGFKKVIIGAKDPTPKASGGAEFLRNQGVEILEGVCLQESLALLYPFLTYQEKGRFNLFKIAQRLNGNYKNGQISNLASKRFTHTQRSNADSLIISGKSVRTDKPKLDTRLSMVQNKTPKIQILTRTATPIDSINAREIRLCANIDELEMESGFNIIEGGYELLFALREKIDALLLIFAPVFEGSGNEMVLPKMDFELLHSQEFIKDAKDIALWFKPKLLS